MRSFLTFLQLKDFLHKLFRFLIHHCKHKIWHACCHYRHQLWILVEHTQQMLKLSPRPRSPNLIMRQLFAASCLKDKSSLLNTQNSKQNSTSWHVLDSSDRCESVKSTKIVSQKWPFEFGSHIHLAIKPVPCNTRKPETLLGRRKWHIKWIMWKVLQGEVQCLRQLLAKACKRKPM